MLQLQGASCKLRELCLPAGLSAKALEPLDKLAAEHCPVPRGETLFHIANPLDTLYAIRTGYSKTSVALEDGRDQVTDFLMAGEVLGMGGMGAEH